MRFYPKSAPGRYGYLYLLGFTDGRIKIGRTTAPRQRMLTHKLDFGNAIGWCHLFAQTGSGDQEYSLKSELALVGHRIGRTEVFEGISKSIAIEICRKSIQDTIEMMADMEESKNRAVRKEVAWKKFLAGFQTEDFGSLR